MAKSGVTSVNPESPCAHIGLKYDVPSFDFEALQREFKMHCIDYMEDVFKDKPSQAVEFCSKIIYEVQPSSAKIKKGSGDRVCKFLFPADKESHTIFVVISKEENVHYKFSVTPTSMVISLTQAGLLAMDTLARLVTLYGGEGGIILTPLAGACFHRDNITALSAELGMDKVQLIRTINESTQREGQYLKYADIDVAVCATLFGTRNMKDKRLRNQIVEKVKKQYMNRNFISNQDRIAIISKYVTHSVPSEFSYEELLKLYDTARSEFDPMKISKESDIPNLSQ